MSRYLFLIHTPLQLFVAEQMLRSMPAFSEENALFFIEGGEGGYQSTENINVEHIHLYAEPFWRYRPKAARRMRDNLSAVKDHAQQGDIILLSDLHWFQNNQIFFDSELADRCHFHVYDEGIGIYLDETVGVRQFLKDTIKMTLSKTGLFPIVSSPYTGHIIGIDHPRIEHIYAFQPSKVVLQHDKPISRIPSPSQQKGHELDSDKWLFLDQHYWFNTGKSEAVWQAFHAHTIEQLQALTGGKCYVKMHHIRREREMEVYQKAGFTLIEDSRPIEAVVAEYGFGNIVSYCSSALANCKHFYPKINAYSIQLEDMIEAGYFTRKRYNEVVRVYDHAGVKRL